MVSRDFGEMFQSKIYAGFAGCLLKFAVIVERDEDGYYVASVPELPGCHTQAKTLDELIKRVREAIEAYLEAEGAEPAQGVDLTGIQFVEVLK